MISYSEGEAAAYQRLTGAAGSAALFTDPGLVAGFEQLAAGCPTYANRYAPRANLYFPLYRAIALAKRVACPLLVTSAERDENIPARSLDGLVRRAPRAELRSYPGGQFALFEGETGRRVLADEVDWLARQLDATTRPASSDTGTQASAPHSGGG